MESSVKDREVVAKQHVSKPGPQGNEVKEAGRKEAILLITEPKSRRLPEMMSSDLVEINHDCGKKDTLFAL